MLDKLFALIAPHSCLGCGRENTLWCESCRGQAVPAVERCYKCHQLSLKGRTCLTCRRTSRLHAVRAVTVYDREAKQLVWTLKFEGAQAAAPIIADMMTETLVDVAPAIIIPIPAASSHVRYRGYDQSRLISRHLSRASGIPALPYLVHVGQQQQREASRRQRLTQLADAFRVTKGAQLEGAHVLLIDDVVTTGATLEAAAVALKAAGANRVSALVFAQA
jgi:ComF family protein